MKLDTTFFKGSIAAACSFFISQNYIEKSFSLSSLFWFFRTSETSSAFSPQSYFSRLTNFLEHFEQVGLHLNLFKMAMHIPKAPGFSSMLKEGARVSKVWLDLKVSTNSRWFK
jgi:hypothetical protein